MENVHIFFHPRHIWYFKNIVLIWKVKYGIIFSNSLKSLDTQWECTFFPPHPFRTFIHLTQSFYVWCSFKYSVVDHFVWVCVHHAQVYVCVCMCGCTCVYACGAQRATVSVFLNHCPSWFLKFRLSLYHMWVYLHICTCVCMCVCMQVYLRSPESSTIIVQLAF